MQIMAGRRAYNERRSKWNKICREKLSAQLRDKLGLNVEPSQVRLKTENTEDPYVWERTEDLEPIFQKNFSDLSTGSLMRLYEALDENEENPKVNALRKRAENDVRMNPEHEASWSHLGFKAKINAQQQEIDHLTQELQIWKDTSESEAQKRHGIQLEMDKLSNRLKEAEGNAELINRELNEWKSIASHLHDSIVQCHEGANVVMKVVDSLKSASYARFFGSQMDKGSVTSNAE